MDLIDEDGLWDSVLLEPLSEETFISNLNYRYDSNNIYTYMGNMLIAVNPNKEAHQSNHVPLCRMYMSPRSGHLPPHIYAIASCAFHWLVNASEDQCVVLQGISGSGKSHSISLLMHCLCGTNNNNVLNKRLLYANTILNSFGNAKTHIHDNASRFIKHIDLELNFKGDILGASITGYLLDKSRVTLQSALNRNFHIFYQLIYGADIHLLKSLKLTRNSENYVYLKCSTRIRQIDIVCFQTGYQNLKYGFEMLGLSESEITSIFKIVSSILKLGSLNIVPTNNIDGTEGSIITNDYELYELGELLGTDGENLKRVLTSSALSSGISAKEARNLKDLLAQSLYTRLFSWLITRLNQSIKAEAKYKRRHLGVFDAFGFDYSDSQMDWDSFVLNSCSDKIHNLVITATLKDEQQEYATERIQWCLIPFYDNTSVCEFIFKAHGGLLSIMDDLILDSNSITIFKRLCALQRPCNSSSHEEQISAAVDQISFNDCFVLNHFMGPVKYKINTFLEKNKNCLSSVVCSTMYNSSHPLLKSLFPEGNPERILSYTVSNPASQLRVWAEAFTATLSGRRCHYITCISPNRHCQANVFDASFVQQQVRWFSLMEVVLLRRSGFCYRLTFEEFLSRYKMLSPATWPKPQYGNTVRSIQALIVCLPIPSGEFVYGATKVFVRSPRSVWELEQLRAERLNQLAALVQETWHRYKRQNCPSKLSNKHHNIRINDSVAAAKCITRMVLTWQKRKYLIKLSKCLSTTSDSPISRVWVPLSNVRFAQTHFLLETLHHKWKCRKYRYKFDQTSRNRMREKVTASLIFKNRKASYSQSVAHPFIGDYVRLRQHVQWRKTALQCDDHHVVFADIVNKITRTSGKFVPTLLVISTKSMLILDQRTLQVKYRVPATDIYRLSLSPFLDNVAVFHIKSAYVRCSEDEEDDDNLGGEWSPSPTGCLFHQGPVVGPSENIHKKKGDFVFQTNHVIEIVTKLFLVIQNVSGSPPDVNISTRFDASFGDQTVTITFKYLGLPDATPGQLKIVRKTNKMEIFV